MNLILTFGTFISIQIFTVRVWYVKNPPPCPCHVFSTLFVKAWRLSSTSSWNLRKNCVRNPVDGLEIRRSPVEAGSWNPINIWRVFLHPNSGWPWDFWTISTSNRCPNHVAWRMSIVSTPPNHSRLDVHVFFIKLDPPIFWVRNHRELSAVESGDLHTLILQESVLSQRSKKRLPFHFFYEKLQDVCRSFFPS